MRFPSRLFLILFSALCVQAERPNVLFLAVDDMNDWIGCHDTTPAVITPNSDRLVKPGVYLPHMFPDETTSQAAAIEAGK